MIFIIIVDKNVTIHHILNGQYSYKGINIYLKNNSYYIELKSGYYFEGDSKASKLELKKYTICNEKVYYRTYLYVYDNQDGIDKFNLYQNTSFVIACNEKANIVCLDKYLKDYYLTCSNGKLTSNYDVIVNHNKYNGLQLNDGDIIEYLGIKIVYFSNFLYINSFNINIKLKEYKIHKALVKYPCVKQNDNYYIPDDIYDFTIDEIKSYQSIQKPNNFDFIKSLIPNFIMCISMGLMAYTNYFNNSKNSNVSLITYIIMPISMMITSIIIPIVFIFISNRQYQKQTVKNKKEYLQYLNKYKNDLDNNIDKYINSLNARYFNLINSKYMMFYAKKNSQEFLKLSIGKIKISKTIKIDRTSDDDINNKLLEIEKDVNNIENYPLYLDLIKNNRVTIVSKQVDKKYFFYRYVLEVAFKHHYDDVNIAVYAKDDAMFNLIFNLPHLFIGNKRLTITNMDGLSGLQNDVLDKPLILFMYDKCNYIFTNENIHQIYFTNSISDILKDSDAIVQFNNNDGCLYLDSRIPFKYVQESINFKDYFSYLGRYKTINNDNLSINYKDIFNDEVNYDNYNKHSLQANFAYNESNLINFDLHESKQGPHGLIGGCTGSGKSELIISLLLSLCIKYPPEYLNIVLIDYKGGGVKESLSYNNVCLPHIIASVSNLSNNALDRLIIALHNECKRRQFLFKMMSQMTNISIMNLDDYLDNYSSKQNLNKIAHLLIVVDEFAELKKENPEQIKELISISRIGRSLGIHLILATQRPAGVIDEEIWSNSHFKIALKVFDEKDSSDIIKRKDAAYLTQPGSFYLQVDSSLIKANSIYSKVDINRNDPYKVSVLDSSLQVIKSYKKQNKQILPTSSYYCHKIIDKCINDGINIPKLNYMPPKPSERHALTKNECIVLGEIDDYLNNRRDLLTYDLKESLFIYSTRKNEINSILNTFNEYNRKCIVIGNSVYKGRCIVDSINNDNTEDIEYLFSYLLNTHNNDLCLLIEDVNCLLSYNDSYLDTLCKLIKRKESLNISIICISSNNQISYKLINCFKNRILINIYENNDLAYFYGMRSQYKGNSYFYRNEPITFVPISEEKYFESIPIYRNIIPRIPEIIKPEVSNSRFLVGYDVNNRNKVFTSKDTIILSFNPKLLEKYTRSYRNIKTMLYTYDLKITSNSNILWLGSGIFNQRLFVVNLQNDLNDEQGIYIENGNKTIVRRLNNV